MGKQFEDISETSLSEPNGMRFVNLLENQFVAIGNRFVVILETG